MKIIPYLYIISLLYAVTNASDHLEKVAHIIIDREKYVTLN
ncbi:hypothetical protein RINTHM_12820 [Richelia intracellularis HM01]|nr:hypothetical protein RINTHM_12820 [Richelia intracellularis HM01]